jgi:hypothetical protein
MNFSKDELLNIFNKWEDTITALTIWDMENKHNIQRLHESSFVEETDINL